MKGEIVAPGTYHDTLPQYLNMSPHQVSQGKFYLKHVEKCKVFTGMYKLLNLNMYKNKTLIFYLYD